MQKSYSRNKSGRKTVSPWNGFTIVELLVVIVVIGILAAITIISYTGVSQRAVDASLQSDLASAKKQLQIYQTENDAYPQEVDDCPTPAAGNLCISQSSGGNNFTNYSVNNSINPPTFTLDAFNSDTFYRVTNDSVPVAVAELACPTGFIVVPGSATYSTSDFCVMKYEAKILGNDVGAQTYNSAFVPESRITGTPWVSMSQANAIAEAQTACEGCHLITEAEWMTIAQNVLSVPGNWSNGSVGSGYVFSGHNDGTPASPLAAAVDSDPYSGTGQSSPSSQKRTLTLSNGEVIWDMAGDVWEWTNGTIAGGQQPGLTGEVAYAWKQWNNISLLMNGMPTSSHPSSTGIVGISGWSSTQGLGQLYSNYGEAVARAFRRGGNWSNNAGAGIFTIHLNYSPGVTYSDVGFRAAR